MRKLTILNGPTSELLAKKIAEEYRTALTDVIPTQFSDGERKPSIRESIRGNNVFIIQSTNQPDSNLFNLLALIDAAKRASAKEIVAVIPYYGYARQDRKDQPRVPITAKLISNLLVEAGATRIVSMDLHADQIQGFFDIPIDHLYASAVFVPHIEENNQLDNLVIASPDSGGAKRAEKYAKFLKVQMCICYKSRSDNPNEIKEMKLLGDVSGKNVVLLDDILDTAGTITKAANLILEKGAKSVKAYCSHPVLSGNAYQKIEESGLSEVFVTDSIPLKNDSGKIKILSVASLFAKVIGYIHNKESVSSLFHVS